MRQFDSKCVSDDIPNLFRQNQVIFDSGFMVKIFVHFLLDFTRAGARVGVIVINSIQGVITNYMPFLVGKKFVKLELLKIIKLKLLSTLISRKMS